MRRLALLALLLAMCAASPAAGWTVTTPAGTVEPGPEGGAVVIAYVPDLVNDLNATLTVTAFRRDGRRLWSAARRPECGNCDDGPQPTRRQPDGTYGPIGYEGDDFWSVDPKGRIVTGCTGVVLPDATCVVARSLPVSVLQPGPPEIAAVKEGVTLWSVTDPGYSFIAEGDEPPMIARDRQGLFYAAFPNALSATPGSFTETRLLAVDPATRSIAWSHTGPSAVLTGLESGVLVEEESELAALGAGGAVLWTRPIRRSWSIVPSSVAFDPARHRLYVGRSGTSPGVTALDSRTGTQIWRTPTRDRARLLSLGANGRVYLAIDTREALAVRAVNPSGRAAWRRGTRLPVTGAHEIRGGLVAVSAGVPASGMPGRLTLIDPR